MGNLILISGKNDSGKSRFAESLIRRIPGERFYIAAMRPCTGENYRRIEAHRRQRQDMHFQTLELPLDVDLAAVTPDSVVLLEDVSNLLANLFFERGEGREEALREERRQGGGPADGSDLHGRTVSGMLDPQIPPGERRIWMAAAIRAALLTALVYIGVIGGVIALMLLVWNH